MPMNIKLQVVSDLHFEHFVDPHYIGFTPAPGADALILAGDIALRAGGVARFTDWPVPVIVIHGNHELYATQEYDHTVIELRQACAAAGLHFLEQDMLVLPGFPAVRFLGTCLWTDYLLFGPARQAQAMAECDNALADHSRIRTQGGRFKPSDAALRHTASREWLRAQLETPFDGKTVVISHHGPHWNSVAPRWRDTLVSAGFASDLTALLEMTDLWIHGHTHDSHSYQVDKCRVVVNPRGYPMRIGAFENPDFNPSLVVSV
jgi:predicted phosphodiesterase